MDISKVRSDIREQVGRMPAISMDSRLLLTLFRLMFRLPRRINNPAGVRMSTHKLDTATIKVYTPVGKPGGGALLWLHGGGYIMGTPSMDDAESIHYASTLNIVVVSVGYRLAPEHPFPAGLDDCVAAWDWLIDSADSLGVDVNRIVVGGESGGGGLAASLCQRLLDEHSVQPVAQLLYYPMLDDRTAANTELDEIRHFFWDNKSNRFGWRSYLGHEPGATNVAQYAVPARREDLSGLPPTWLGVGDLDVFYEENIAYVNRLRAAGVDCIDYQVEGAPHGFQTMLRGTKISEDFLDETVEFLGDKYKDAT